MEQAVGRSPKRGLVVAAVAAALIGLVIVLLTSLTHAWAQEQVEAERLLPGTTVAAVDVGGLTVEEATAVLERTFEERLDLDIAIRAGDRTWTTSPRDLGTTVDAAAAARTALETSAATGLPRVTAVRWFGAGADVRIDVEPLIDEAVLATFVEEIAQRVDGEAVPATARWTADGTKVVEDAIGFTLLRDEAADVLVAAVDETTTTSRDAALVIELPTSQEFAQIRSGDVEAVLPALDAAVARSLDRRWTFREGAHSWSIAGAELARGADLDEAAATAVELAGEGRGHDEIAAALAPVPLVADESSVSALLDEVAADVTVEPVDATIDYSSGWIEIIDAVEGHALDREAAVETVREALLTGSDFVDLPSEAVEPERTAEDYHDVLLVRQNERKLYHYRDGEIVADWSVAVGTGQQPTPTGVFTIGAKRYMPTWHNPAPDRWGADMPEVVGPGPDNPLGVRALNWNRNGADTLIRFHGTAQVGSIGRAASNGCVRLTNSDVIDLYNRIPSGTTVVSIHG